MTESAAAQQSSAPDWENSAQEIICPLCEYNLRGLSEPRCPECGYRFQWAELHSGQRGSLSPRRLYSHSGQMISCEYNLRGLSEPRCPECGYRFQWAELLESQGNKHPYLFEQQTGDYIDA